MATVTPADLDVSERDDFLGVGGTGVISFASETDEPPHSVPVSYGYDATAETFYFRLAVGREHAKTPLTDRPVSFVVYGSTEGTWCSVVATGTLERTLDESIATETLAGLERVDIPFVDIFGRAPKDLEFEFYRLVPTSLTGRKESPTEL